MALSRRHSSATPHWNRTVSLPASSRCIGPNFSAPRRNWFINFVFIFRHINRLLDCL